MGGNLPMSLFLYCIYVLLLLQGKWGRLHFTFTAVLRSSCGGSGGARGGGIALLLVGLDAMYAFPYRGDEAAEGAHDGYIIYNI